MSIQFSIIIPCYNAVEYVDRAMKSVVEQTMDRSLYEIIAVNDASTDDTLERLNCWARRYPGNIKVITYNTNLRQGGARNIAIRQARGEYICFLDADDWMEKDALATFAVGIKNRFDIVTAKFVESYEYGLDHDVYPDSAPVEKVYLTENRKEFIERDLGFVWSSVYRRSMITDNEVWFPEHLAYEDVSWQRLIKYYARTACILDRITHHHYNHPESTMNSRNASHHIDRLTCYEMLLDEYSARGLLDMYYPQILRDTIETYYFNSYYMFFRLMDDIPDVYGRIRKTIYGFFPSWENDYDDSDIPMVFQYMIKLLKKAANVSPDQMKPFKETILELSEE